MIVTYESHSSGYVSYILSDPVIRLGRRGAALTTDSPVNMPVFAVVC